MKLERIGLHTMVIFNTEAMTSTVRLGPALFETIVMFDDGDEMELVRTSTLEEAKATHNRLMHKYNDLIYEGSTAKLLGAPNLGGEKQ